MKHPLFSVFRKLLVVMVFQSEFTLSSTSDTIQFELWLLDVKNKDLWIEKING